MAHPRTATHTSSNSPRCLERSAVARLHAATRRCKIARCHVQAKSEQQIPADAVNVLESMRVILVAPKTPANIGAVARACANFEATDLWVVKPRCDAYDGEVVKVACGVRVLQQMTVVNDLQQALNETTSSIGFTRRAGATRLTHGSIAELLQKYPDAIAALDAVQHRQQCILPTSLGKTALVFGREESGLTEDEVRLCQHACAIPTGRTQGSLNLSHAVAVVLAGVFERRLQLLGLSDLGLEVNGTPITRKALQPAAGSEVAALLAKVSQIAANVGLNGEESRGGGAQGSHGRRRLAVGHIRSILSRAQASTWEVRSLHGLATAILNRVQEPGSSNDGTAETARLPSVDSTSDSSGSSSSDVPALS
eukprot:GHRR01014747.1.p1 GENE.GHRR01014747.1~~GHRR01014747.1.p1  ORF type:complete len:367 (+),score=101.63 GHRR01014747.1:1455-2555(+)